jgi:hypothetical protein
VIPILANSDEHISRKEWKLNLALAVAPLMYFGRQRKKNRYTLFRQFGGNPLFMPGSSLNGKPRIFADCSWLIQDRVLLSGHGFALLSHNLKVSCGRRIRHN